MHSYPHCWRCATPLIYKPVSSWFVSVTKIKPRLLELNQQINWIPENVKDGQFGKWLANARDWSISRNRFWGSPIPVWVSDDPKYPRVDVYGSLEELKADFGDYPRDKDGNVNMHRPWIDNLTRVNPDDPTGKSHMHRISDVLDCWFESGSMSFAQFHYPFQVMLPVWSSYYFFTLYANAANGGAGFDARQLRADEVAGLPQMDRYLLARTRRLVERVEKSLNEFAISDACDVVSDFIDVLTNWYIRNTRDRFWNEDANAFNTLYTVLEAFMRVLAPLAPMEAESVWRGLTGGESVHLADWPYVVDEKTGADTELGRVLVDDPALVAAMEKVREVVSGTLSLRKAAKIRVRQPLAKLTVVAEDVDAVKAYDELLKSELNVKDIEFCTMEDAGSQGLKIVHELRVNARAAGPRLGKQVQFAIKASKSGDWSVNASGAPVVSTPSGDLELVEGEYELINRVEEENAAEAAASVSAALPTGGFVILDTALDDDLLAEGYARDAIRAVQDARKAADLDIADRISLVLTVPAVDVAKVEQFKDLIAHETLATSFEVKEGAELAVEVAKA